MLALLSDVFLIIIWIIHEVGAVMVNQLAKLFIVGALSSNLAYAKAEEATDWNADTLTGDWNGGRSRMVNSGISLELIHKSDFLINASGGIKRGFAWMANTEAGVLFDLDKMLNMESTTVYVHLHGQSGDKFNRDYVGSFVGVDNIETSVNTWQFNEAWIQKDFSASSLSILAGLYAIDSEFYVTDSSGVFIQPPYGMANDLASTGKNGPPIFPLGALALRIKYTPSGKDLYFQGVVTDGVPGDPGNPYGTHIQLNEGDGTLSVIELGYTPQSGERAIQDAGEYFNKTALGLWRYTSNFPDLADPTILHPSHGFYIFAERSLAADAEHPGRGMSGFIRFGNVSRQIHQSDWTGSIGLRYRGLIDAREEDISGIAITVNHAGSLYRQVTANSETYQTTFEATYQYRLYPWLSLQPDLQFISNPNMDKTIGNVWLAGMRLEMVF